jgi:hypothetical protein
MSKPDVMFWKTGQSGFPYFFKKPRRRAEAWFVGVLVTLYIQEVPKGLVKRRQHILVTSMGIDLFQPWLIM